MNISIMQCAKSISPLSSPCEGYYLVKRRGFVFRDAAFSHVWDALEWISKYHFGTHNKYTGEINMFGSTEIVTVYTDTH